MQTNRHGPCNIVQIKAVLSLFVIDGLNPDGFYAFLSSMPQACFEDKGTCMLTLLTAECSRFLGLTPHTFHK